jgi:hypothetical protein
MHVSIERNGVCIYTQRMLLHTIATRKQLILQAVVDIQQIMRVLARIREHQLGQWTKHEDKNKNKSKINQSTNQ